MEPASLPSGICSWAQKLEQFALGVDAELSKNGSEMIAHGALAHEQRRRNRSYTLPLEKQAENLPLAGGQFSQLRVLAHSRKSVNPVEDPCGTNFGPYAAEAPFELRDPVGGRTRKSLRCTDECEGNAALSVAEVGRQQAHFHPAIISGSESKIAQRQRCSFGPTAKRGHKSNVVWMDEVQQ